MALKEYRVYVSQEPTEAAPAPQIFTGSVFAVNEVVARSKIFNMLRQQYKIKSTGCVVLKCEQVAQYTDVKARNYAVSAFYRSTKGVHNVQKEMRALTRVGAVEMFFSDMHSRHKVKSNHISILDVSELDDKDVTNKELLQILKDPKYPSFDKRVPRSAPTFQKVPADY